MGDTQCGLRLCLMMSLLVVATACSKVSFVKPAVKTQASDTGTNQEDPGQQPPLPSPLPPPPFGKVVVNYPEFKISDSFSGIAYQIKVVVSPDRQACELRAISSTFDFEELLDKILSEQSLKIMTLSNYSCWQAVRAEQIRVATASGSCTSSEQDLSAQELAEMNDPAKFSIEQDPDFKLADSGMSPEELQVLNSGLSGFFGDPEKLNRMTKIAIDSDCRCFYPSKILDLPVWPARTPALEAHCKTHFPTVYQ